MSDTREVVLPRLAAALAEKYDLSVSAYRLEHAILEGCQTAYTGWGVRFEAKTVDELMDAELATRAEFKPEDSWYYDEHGSHRYVCGGERPSVLIHIYDTLPETDPRERRINAKKRQREVARLLKRAFALPRREARA